MGFVSPSQKHVGKSWAPGDWVELGYSDTAPPTHTMTTSLHAGCFSWALDFATHSFYAPWVYFQALHADHFQFSTSQMSRLLSAGLATLIKKILGAMK